MHDVNAIGRLAALLATAISVAACGGGGGGDNGGGVTGYTVTATTGTNGAVSPGSIEVDADTTAQLTLTPDVNYSFDSATGTCSGILVGDIYTTGPINADCSVNFTFVYVGPPLTPATASLGGAQQQFVFTWIDVGGAEFYRLLENPDGVSGYVQVSGDIVSGVESYAHPVTLYRRINARYILQSCNTAGCTDGAALLAANDLVSPIVYIKASNTGDGDSFGYSAALSADGTTLAVGALAEDSDAQSINGDQNNDLSVNSGAVYVFVRSGGAWSQQAYIKASDAAAGDTFGTSVSLSDDGNLLAVGGYAVNAVYLFSRSAGDWSELQRLAHPDVEAGDRFGQSVSLSGNGLNLAIGAPGDDSDGDGVGAVNNNGGTGTGAVYVYQQALASWVPSQYIKASNPDDFDSFGWAVSLDLDGTTLAAGAAGDDSENFNPASNNLGDSGAVYIFQFDAAWSQQVFLKASNLGTGARFGTSLDLDDAGDTLAVGAYGEDSVAENSGAAYVFQQGGPTPLIGFWTQYATVFKAGNADEDDSFGEKVTLSADGDTLAIAAWSESGGDIGVAGGQDNDDAIGSGAVYMYGFDNTTWSELAYVKARHRDDNAQFGSGLALSGDGDTLAVGAAYEHGTTIGIDSTPNLGGNSSGAVFVY